MIYRVSLVLEALLIIKCIHDLYGEKLRIRTGLIVFMACDLVLMECVYQGYVPNLCSSLVYVMLVVYCIKEFKAGVKQMLVNLALTIVILGVLQIGCVTLSNIMFGACLEEVQVLLLSYIFMIIVYVPIARVVDMERVSRYFQRSYVIIWTCLIVGAVTIIGCIIATKVSSVIYWVIYIVVAIPVVLICVMAVSWLKNKEKAIEAEAQLKAFTLYEKSYENLILEIRTRQHEFDNHINAIYNQHLLYKDYDSLVKHQKEYCEALTEDQKFARLLKVGNTALAGFLYGKFAEAQRAGINVSYEIMTSKVMRGVPEYKVIEIIGNLINNAMEALKSTQDKRMNVKIYADGNRDVIVVENKGAFIQPIEINKLFQKGYSSKGENRGLGLYNLKKMSVEYDYRILCSNNEREGVNWVSFMIEKEY